MQIILLMLLLLITGVAMAHDAELDNLIAAVEQHKALDSQAATDFIEQIMVQTKDEVKAPALVPENSCSQRVFNIKPEVFRRARYLIFISFSMPKASLKALYQAASKSGGVLLLRGLKNNSFKATAEYLKQLEIAVDIDPEAFKEYHITKVPTFVLVKNKEHHSIVGNISFSYAKAKLSEAAK